MPPDDEQANNIHSTCNTENNRQISPENSNPRLRIILVRHGESQNNIYHEISLQSFEENRVPDPSMTERGKQQALHVAKYIQSGENAVLINIDDIFVSPMLRTLQTAQPISKALGIDPIIWTDIYEISGVHEQGAGQGGMSRSAIQKEFPSYQLPETITESGWYDVTLGRESNHHGKLRVQKVWNHLVEMAQEITYDRTIMMVVHGDFIDHLIQAALGIMFVEEKRTDTDVDRIDPRLTEKQKIFPTWNASISALDLKVQTSKIPTILFHNSVTHLPPDLVKTHKLGKC